VDLTSAASLGNSERRRGLHQSGVIGGALQELSDDEWDAFFALADA
jgi:hypothetical protein